MSDPEDRLVDLAGSVSDGAAVDWDGEEEAGVDGGLQGLKTLEQVASAFSATHGEREEPSDVLFRWGPLEVLEKFGEGTFGEVFRARDPQVERQVALKLSREEGPLVRTWLAEAQRLASVRNPHVVTVFGAAVHNGRAGFWTDLLTGPTLEQRLESDGPLGPGELIVAGYELSRALAAVHSAGLVHGDVKTSNVIRDGDGKLVLVDFGATRSTSEGPAPVPQGTPSYLAPEVAAGGTATPSSDLYALGALLFRLATGRHRSEVEASSLRDLRPILPSGLVAVVDALLSDDPDERPASAGDVERRLIASQTEGLRRVARPAGRRWRRWLPVAALALVLVAGIAWWMETGSSVVPSGEPFRADLWSERGDSEVRLADGSAVRPGDRLALRVEVDEPTHIYVFNEDEAGHLFVLFPLPDLLPRNPLTPGEHRLPGRLDGEPQSWEVTSAGGQERFLIVGSKGTVPELERLREEQELARRGREVEHSASTGETLRGVGGLQASSSSGADSRLGRIHADLARRGDAVWAEMLVLDNPR